ncbi:MAG: outer membrane lipoprotein-sorting protein [Pseudomonadales bacterium]
MSVATSKHAHTGRFFDAITRHPKKILTAGIVCIVATCAGLGQLVKDTSVNAFIPQDHPSIIASDRARDLFGLSDPVVVALQSSSESIFQPQHLTTISVLHEAIATLPNVRSDRVMSLESESSIIGYSDRIDVERYADDVAPDDREAAQRLRARWRSMPPHIGTLASDDGRGAIIIAELLDEHAAGATYAAIMQLLETTSLNGLEAHVAGQGAVVGHLSSTIDTDSRVLQPMIFVTVLAILFIAFRTAAAVGLPVLIIVGAAGGAIGLMAYSGISYYAITSALPVILVAVAVADTIHILTAYYVQRAQASSAKPEAVRASIIDTMTSMLRPITLTTLTTMAGFIGIAVAEIMPPIIYFAIYAAVGVALAWVYSIILLPCVMTLVRPKPSPLFARWTEQRQDRIARTFTAIGTAAAQRPVTTLALAGLVIAIAVLGATQLRVDRALVEGFKPSAAIRIADETINREFAGTAFLDVMVRADSEEGLLTAAAMQRISALQTYMESLPRMQHTMAITDYISLLHQAMEEQPAPAGSRPLPDQDAAIAQYLLVYEASGDPTDFEEEIDGNYQTALVRGVMNTRYFSEERYAVDALSAYIDEHLSSDGLSAELTGRVNVRYHWMVRLAEHHAMGVVLSLALVFAIAAFLFRSLSAGLVSVLPVSITVLCLYGVMGWLEIYLEPATTMFAAISLGVGVDFAIHLVARLRDALRSSDGDVLQAIELAMPETARACFFNAVALGVGFSVLMFSELLTLKRFGGMVAIAAALSFVWALILVPALYGLAAKVKALHSDGLRNAAGTSTSALLLLALAVFTPDPAQAEATAPQPTLSGTDIAQAMNERPDGDYVVRQIAMSMTNKRGQERTREAMILRARTDTERRTLIVYLGPKSVRETAFLGYDYSAAGKDDDQWLYLPAMRKIRRIPASDRGDYFLGTDFTYEDMQSELKFDLDDYDFSSTGLSADGSTWHLSGVPKSKAIAKALGYGGFSAEVDAVSWIPRRIEFSDTKNKRLKTIAVARSEQIDGIWTAMEIEASNHQTSHVTRFNYEDVSYPDTLPAELFVANSLRRGVPQL